MTANELSSPRVGDWKQSVDENGLVRIPLKNPGGHSWFASLQMGTPLQQEMMCALDNNHALTVVFSKGCLSCPEDTKRKGFDKSTSTTYMTRDKHELIVRDDGFVMNGFTGADKLCIGGYVNRKQATFADQTVCMNDQIFFHADRISEYNWPARATNSRHINAICGLGKEKTTGKALGIMARAK